MLIWALKYMVFSRAGSSAANLQNRHCGLFFPFLIHKVQPRAGVLVFVSLLQAGVGAAAGQDTGHSRTGHRAQQVLSSSQLWAPLGRGLKHWPAFSSGGRIPIFVGNC